MKNVSSLKSNATNSPKTPGGISKSLLTPCRRLGLSRNWRNKGPLPFISPLAGSNQEVKEEKSEPRKRKQRVLDDNIESTPETSAVDKNEIDEDQSNHIDKTPSRTIEVPRRKKSKTLLAAISKSQEDIYVPAVTKNDNEIIAKNDHISERVETPNTENIEVVSTPVRTKSKKSKKMSPRVKLDSKSTNVNSTPKPDVCNDVNTNSTEEKPKESPEAVYEIKEKSPNDLKKECVVVIQRKIFKKTEDSEKEKGKIKKDKKQKSTSQTLFDSDSDETPLIQLNDKESSKNKAEKKAEELQQAPNKKENTKDLNEDDDFIDKSTKIQVTKVKEIKSPTSKLKTNKIPKPKVEKLKVQPIPPSQSSFDDDDDFDNNKKTILIRKTYEKVTKPLKAKSTGSITQKDIDDLKARIEAKKKLLLAQSINPDTEELRNLIKKWQKGCQNALIELLDLMKTQFQDKQDMNYSEMLKSLKIPPSLVGYDAQNDSFNEPNDASIILGKFEDI